MRSRRYHSRIKSGNVRRNKPLKLLSAARRCKSSSSSAKWSSHHARPSPSLVVASDGSPPYKKIKDDILGKDYELSLAFLSPKEMLAVTKKWKKKDHISNSSPFLFLKTPERYSFAKKPRLLITRLFVIHGLCHLKGYKHGATMENIERLYLKKWDINAHEQNNSRNRHRNLPR